MTGKAAALDSPAPQSPAPRGGGTPDPAASDARPNATGTTSGEGASHAFREAGLGSRAFRWFFQLATLIPGPLRATRWFWIWLARQLTPQLRHGALVNARRLLGRDADATDCERLAWRTVSAFYDFVLDTAVAARQSRTQLAAQIASVEGTEHYDAARQAGRGVILVTAHLGAFEVGAAALLERESRIHIVYYHDPRDTFAQVRARTRERLGLIEARANEGWNTWVSLRDALANDDAVLVQGDRVMPGQAGVSMPFLGGHMLMPVGPAKLALLSGAPMLPVFAVPMAQGKDHGKVRVFIEPPIAVTREQGRVDASHPAMRTLADTIARYVSQYPEQWHVLHPAFCEDQAATRGGPEAARA